LPLIFGICAKNFNGTAGVVPWQQAAISQQQAAKKAIGSWQMAVNQKLKMMQPAVNC
jgi:hypothetical protein